MRGKGDSPSARSFRFCNPPSANTELISRELAPPFSSPSTAPKRKWARGCLRSLGSPLRSSFPSHIVLPFLSLFSIHLRSYSCFCLLFELPSSPCLFRPTFASGILTDATRQNFQSQFTRLILIDIMPREKTYEFAKRYLAKSKQCLITCLQNVTLCQLENRNPTATLHIPTYIRMYKYINLVYHKLSSKTANYWLKS